MAKEDQIRNFCTWRAALCQGTTKFISKFLVMHFKLKLKTLQSATVAKGVFKLVELRLVRQAWKTFEIAS